jgi:hypothetical protein
MAQIMSIAAFDYAEPAERVAIRLRDAGFKAEMHDETSAQKWQLYNLHPRAQFRVVVPEDTAEAVAAQLNEWDRAEQFLAGAIRCPQCQSLRVEYPQFSRRTLMGALPAALAAAGVIERDFFCTSCQFTWPEQETPVPELDALGWSKGKPLVKGVG